MKLHLLSLMAFMAFSKTAAVVLEPADNYGIVCCVGDECGRDKETLGSSSAPSVSPSDSPFVLPLAQCPELPVDICIAIDQSGSICTKQGQSPNPCRPSTNETANALNPKCDLTLNTEDRCINFQEVRDFVSSIITKVDNVGPNKQFSLVVFSDPDKTRVIQELGSPEDALATMESHIYEGGNTDTSGAIKLCRGSLTNPDTEQVIILVTDGTPTRASPTDACKDFGNKKALDKAQCEAQLSYNASITMLPMYIQNSVSSVLDNMYLFTDDEDNVVAVDSFEALPGALNDLLNKIECSVPSAEPSLQGESSPSESPSETPSATPSASPSATPSATPSASPIASTTTTAATTTTTQGAIVFDDDVTGNLVDKTPDCPDPCPGRPAQSTGDPHLRTFDGLKYDCQAKGDVYFLKSLNSNFQIQGRFDKPPSMNGKRRVTWTTGVTVREGSWDIPDIQFSQDDPFGYRGGTGEVMLYVNGTLIADPEDPDFEIHPDVEFTSNGGRWKVRFWNGLEVSVGKGHRRSMSTYLYLPLSYRTNETFVGVMGNANGNRDDDWLEWDGSSIAIANGGTKGSAAYGYCMRWCIDDQADSIFDYTNTGDVFDQVNGCEDPYYMAPEPPLPPIPQEILDACATAEDREGCILDALVGGEDPAQILLDELTALAELDREKKWLHCGDRLRSDCVKKEGTNELLAFVTETHPFACCSELEMINWRKNGGCDFWTSVGLSAEDDAANKCSSEMTYADATQHCADQGAVLCPKEALFDGCARGLGCNLEKKLIWSSDGPSNQLVLKQWVACGRAGRCTESYGQGAMMVDILPDLERRKLTETEPRHDVYCCSETQRQGWSKRGHCGVWVSGDPLGMGCAADKTFEEAVEQCFLVPGEARLCTREELINDCANGAGCGFDDDYVWTGTPGFEEVKPEPKPLDPFEGIQKQWLACADRFSSECVKYEGSNSRLAAQEEEHEVLCCKDSETSPGDSWRSTCRGIWATGKPDGQTCVHSATYEDAKGICEAAGARLCSKSELLDDLCGRTAAHAACDHRKDLVWTSDAALSGAQFEGVAVTDGLEWKNWMACGRRGSCQNELFGAGAKMEVETTLAPLLCCADSWHNGWKKNGGGCTVWSKHIGGDSLFNLEDSMATCDALDARLCTMQELAKGCGYQDNNPVTNNKFVWTQTPGWEVLPALTAAVATAEDKYWLSCGDRLRSECVRREGQSAIIAATSEKHEVRCCASDNNPDPASGLWKTYPECPNVWTASKLLRPGSTTAECIHKADFFEAGLICAASGGRLCTKEEVQNRCARDSSGCDHDKDLLWTSTEVAYDVSEPMNWLSCGKSQNCWDYYGRGAKLASGTSHPVRCCSDNWHNGWRKNGGGCDVWTESKLGRDGSVCYDAETLENAEKICRANNARLCTKEELKNNCGQDNGNKCGYDNDFVWTSTIGWNEINVPALPDPRDSEEKYFISCANRLSWDCVRREGLNEDIAAVSELHEVMCCSDSPLEHFHHSNNCPGLYVSADPDGTCTHSATFLDAESICSTAGGRLCTRDEVFNTCGKDAANTCGHRSDLVWTSTEVEGELDKKPWVGCAKNQNCWEKYGWGGRFAVDTETHSLQCCSDDYMAGWKKNGGCSVWSHSVGDCNSTYTLDQSIQMCENIGARLCTKRELVKNCGANAGCPENDNDFVWTKSEGYVEKYPTPIEKDPYKNENKHWRVCSNRLDSECVRKEGDNEILSSESELHEVMCCADEIVDGVTQTFGSQWKKSSQCPFIWASANPYGTTCEHSANYTEAEEYCAGAGGRLCTRSELMDRCAAEAANTCSHKRDLVWSSTPPASDLEWKPWLSCGQSRNCYEHYGAGGRMADPTLTSEIHSVRCCSDSYRSNWKKHGHCSVWTKSVGNCSAEYTFDEAWDMCESLDGARLCTKQELEANCANDAGCDHDSAFVWTMTPGWVEVAPPQPVDPDTEDKYWLSCADPGRTECMRRDGAYDTPAAVSEQHEVVCCTDTDPAGAPDWIKKDGCSMWTQARVHGVCHYSATFEDATKICANSGEGGRLCTQAELQSECADRAGCSHEKDLVWSSNKVDDTLLAPKKQWTACGRSWQCGDVGSYLVDTDPATVADVRCCSDDYKQNWKRHGHCDVWAMSYTPTCSAVSFSQAEAICATKDARLCTKEEVLRDCTRDTGCGSDNRQIWTSTPGWVVE